MDEWVERLDPWNSWASLSRLIGVPTVAAAVALIGGLNSDDAFTVIVPLVLAVVYSMTFIASSFGHKRSIFLGLAGTWSEETDPKGHNVYRTEGELWSCLGCRKRPEPPIDRVGLAVLPGVFCLVAAVVAITGGDPPISTLERIGTGAFAVVLAVGVVAVFAQRRLWR